jgi:MFS family permease
MNLLDAGIVFLELPGIQQDLHASYAAPQWMAAGYTLAFMLVLITAGRLGDIFGRNSKSTFTPNPMEETARWN